MVDPIVDFGTSVRTKVTNSYLYTVWMVHGTVPVT